MDTLILDPEVLDVPALIGYNCEGEPIWSIAGAADPEEDEDEDDEDEGEDEEEDEESDSAEEDEEDEDEEDESDSKSTKRPKPGDGKRDPRKKGPNYDITLRKERMARRKLQRENAALRKKNETDGERLQREAEEAASKKYKPVAMKAAAKSALVAAKVKGNPDRALRLLDLDDLDINEENDVEGLDEAVDILKSEYPELFDIDGDDDDDDEEDEKKPPAKKRPAAKVDGSNKKPVKKPAPKTSAEKLVAQAGLAS